MPFDLTTTNLVLNDLTERERSRQVSLNASFNNSGPPSSGNAPPPINSTDSGGSEFNVAGVGGSFSTAALDGTTQATIGAGNVTVTSQSEDETAAQLVETNRDINNATTITRDTSFDTGNVFIDVDAARRAEGNVEAIKELNEKLIKYKKHERTALFISQLEKTFEHNYDVDNSGNLIFPCIDGSTSCHAELSAEPILVADCGSVGGITTCVPVDKTFKSFNFETPKDWRDFEDGPINFHNYRFEDVIGKGDERFGEVLREELIKSPTNDKNAATINGSLNNVGPLAPFSGRDDVLSFITEDGVANVTQENHFVRSGFVARRVEKDDQNNWSIITIGEGDSLNQKAPGANSLASRFWTENAALIRQRVFLRLAEEDKK